MQSQRLAEDEASVARQELQSADRLAMTVKKLQLELEGRSTDLQLTRDLEVLHCRFALCASSRVWLSQRQMRSIENRRISARLHTRCEIIRNFFGVVKDCHRERWVILVDIGRGASAIY